MNGRLLEAAQAGNVELLRKLIKDDPLTLQAVALAEGQTPLHVASLAGHLNFVQEILRLKKEFARELNQDGFTPLHISSANGYLEIVKELLKFDRDQDLCLVKGREGRIPLHYAASKGRVHVMKELLLASPNSVEEVTARGETSLQLAVKSNQFESLVVLVEHLKKIKKEGVLNKEDELGNTVLHLSVSRKQYEVVALLLGQDSSTKEAVKVNSLNKSGLTPLDALLLFQSEAGDREIEEILRQAGGVQAKDLQSITQNQDSAHDHSVPGQVRSPATRLLEYFRYNSARDSPSEARNILLVVATLVTIATYQAVLSPPGGVWQDDDSSPNPHTAGTAVMGNKSMGYYGVFLLFNSLGFFASLRMIFILTYGFPLRFELQVSMLALTVTYDASMAAIAPTNTFIKFFTAISIALPVLLYVIAMVGRNCRKRGRPYASV